MENDTPSLYKSGVRPLVDNYLLERAAEVRDYGSYWSASSAGYCMRKNIFDRLGVTPVSTDARKQRVFESGHIFHAWMQGVTKDAGVSVAQELRLKDNDLMVQGHFDDLVKAESLILYDYKTAHSGSFAYKKGKPMSRYHQMQLGTYLLIILKLVNGSDKVEVWDKDEDGHYNKNITLDFKKLVKSLDGLREGRILSISKDDLRMDETQLLYTSGLAATVTEYWTILNNYWSAKKMPACTCGDHERNSKTGIGFMAQEKYNPYFFQGEPCSLVLYRLWKEGRTKEYIKEG